MRITSPTQPALPPFDVDTGHGKLEALLTLTDAKDAATLRGLIGESDVFVESYRPGAMGKLGFSPQTSLKHGLKKFVEWYREYYAVEVVKGSDEGVRG